MSTKTINRHIKLFKRTHSQNENLFVGEQTVGNVKEVRQRWTGRPIDRYKWKDNRRWRDDIFAANNLIININFTSSFSFFCGCENCLLITRNEAIKIQLKFICELFVYLKLNLHKQSWWLNREQIWEAKIIRLNASRRFGSQVSEEERANQQNSQNWNRNWWIGAMKWHKWKNWEN